MEFFEWKCLSCNLSFKDSPTRDLTCVKCISVDSLIDWVDATKDQHILNWVHYWDITKDIKSSNTENLE